MYWIHQDEPCSSNQISLNHSNVCLFHPWVCDACATENLRFYLSYFCSRCIDKSFHWVTISISFARWREIMVRILCATASKGLILSSRCIQSSLDEVCFHLIYWLRLTKSKTCEGVSNKVIRLTFRLNNSTSLPLTSSRVQEETSLQGERWKHVVKHVRIKRKGEWEWKLFCHNFWECTVNTCGELYHLNTTTSPIKLSDWRDKTYDWLNDVANSYSINTVHCQWCLPLTSQLVISWGAFSFDSFFLLFSLRLPFRCESCNVAYSTRKKKREKTSSLFVLLVAVTRRIASTKYGRRGKYWALLFFLLTCQFTHSHTHGDVCTETREVRDEQLEKKNKNKVRAMRRHQQAQKGRSISDEAAAGADYCSASRVQLSSVRGSLHSPSFSFFLIFFQPVFPAASTWTSQLVSSPACSDQFTVTFYT